MTDTSTQNAQGQYQQPQGQFQGQQQQGQFQGQQQAPQTQQQAPQQHAKQLVARAETIVGNLTADPELRYTQSGLAVCNFTVAVTERVRNAQTNEYEDGATTYYRVSVWREQAEHAAASLIKGMRVTVNGKVYVRGYTNREGVNGFAIELDAAEVSVSVRYGTTVFTRSQPQNQGQGQGQPQGQFQGQGQGQIQGQQQAPVQPQGQGQFQPQGQGQFQGQQQAPAQPQGQGQFQPQGQQQPLVQQAPVQQVQGQQVGEVVF